MKVAQLFSVLALSLLGITLLFLVFQQPVSVDSLRTTGRVTSFGSSSESSASVSSAGAAPSEGVSGGSESAGTVSSESSSDSQSSSNSASSGSSGASSGASSGSASASTPKSVSPSSVKASPQGTIVVKPSTESSGASPSPAGSSTTVASSGSSASAEEVRQFSVTRGGTVPAGEAIQAAVQKYGLGSDAKISYSAGDGSAKVSGYRVGKLFGIIQVRVPMEASITQAGVEAKAPFWASFVR